MPKITVISGGVGRMEDAILLLVRDPWVVPTGMEYGSKSWCGAGVGRAIGCFCLFGQGKMLYNGPVTDCG